MVTLVMKNLNYYAKEIMDIFGHKHILKKDYSGSRVERGNFTKNW